MIIAETCSINTCDRPKRARGWCTVHYVRWKKTGDPMTVKKAGRRPVTPHECAIGGCQKVAKRRNWCISHYKKWQKYGDPLTSRVKERQKCTVSDCGRWVKTHNLCIMHLKRWQKYGDPTIVKNILEHHGLHNTSEYKIWVGVKQRTNNPNSVGYKDYGGRGIVICRGWKDSFSAFYSDMAAKPGPGYSIDRIDNNGNYSCGHCDECANRGWPANCRWATMDEQRANTRRSITLTLLGETKSFKEWANILGVNYMTLYNRVKLGWDEERLLSSIRTKKLTPKPAPHGSGYRPRS